ncbi:hypothetical protein [Bacteroides bouchesdurhonensis]
MEKNIIDIILELKIKNAGALNNVKLQIDGLNNSAIQATNETKRLGEVFRKLKIPDLNALFGFADRLGSVFGNLSKEGVNFRQKPIILDIFQLIHMLNIRVSSMHHM